MKIYPINNMRETWHFKPVHTYAEWQHKWQAEKTLKSLDSLDMQFGILAGVIDC